MAFPASKGVLSQVLENASSRALWLKVVAQNARNAMAAGNVGSNQIVDLDSQFRAAKTELQGYGSTAGIVDEARKQFSDPELDVVAEWTAMIAAIDGVTNWIRANFPVGTGAAAGFLLERTWGEEGPVYRQFTPAQTAGLRTQLDALIATIS